MNTVTIKREVFDQIADLLRSALQNPVPALAVEELSQDYEIQIEEDGKVVAQFSHDQICAELLRNRQAEVPSEEAARRMVKNAGIKTT